MKKQLFNVLGALMVLSMLLTACGGAATPAPTAAPTQAPTQAQPVQTEEAPLPSKYKQAPMLDAMNLPPIEERLPVAEDIKVITPWESVGKYGGQWNDVTWWDGAGNIKMMLYDPPVRWKADLTGYEPGLLIKMPEWSDGGKTITFTFRRGIKWSDGAPFTTADLKFWWEDLAKNEDYKTANVPWWARNSDGSPITMEFPNDYTWVLKFDKPQYIMPYILAQGFWEWEPLMKPAHFLKQYHPNYGGKSGAEGYTELDLMDRWFDTPGYPCLMAWCLKEYKPGEYRILERNPYYWKVDIEGNQLPYIDSIRVELVEDSEVRLLAVAQGKYDCNFRYNGAPTDIPFLMENAAAGNYRLVPGWMNGAGAWPGIIVNQDYHRDREYDPAKETEEDIEIRELLRNQDFRIGLSYAMNRQRVVDVAWEGIGEPKNFTISPQSPHFTSSAEGMKVYEQWANSYAEYNPEKAKEHFDKAGFVDANGDGIRDLPSGKPFTLVIDLNDWSSEKINTEFLQVYKLNLEAVGVKVLINNVIGTPDAGPRGDYGLYMLRTTHASELDLWTYPDWVFPVRGGGEGTRAWPQQGLWYSTGGKEGWEPQPGSPAYRLQEIYRKGLQEPDEQKRHELVWEAIGIYLNEGPFIIGAAGDQPMPVVCKNYFKNVYEYGVLGPWAPGTPGNTFPEQFWMDK